jgi:hypothetical protein
MGGPLRVAEVWGVGAGSDGLLAGGAVIGADVGADFLGGGSSLRSAHRASSLALLASCRLARLELRAASARLGRCCTRFRRYRTSARRCASSLSRSISRDASACTYCDDAGNRYGKAPCA